MVDSSYLAYLHGFDNRVSLKKDRPYVGLAVRINDKIFVIPLTSQTTQERKKRGLKKRNSLTTTFVKASGVEISDLLHNNMIPVPKELAKINKNRIAENYLQSGFLVKRKSKNSYYFFVFLLRLLIVIQKGFSAYFQSSF